VVGGDDRAVKMAGLARQGRAEGSLARRKRVAGYLARPLPVREVGGTLSLSVPHSLVDG
jgi:hypothetical protein